MESVRESECGCRCNMSRDVLRSPWWMLTSPNPGLVEWQDGDCSIHEPSPFPINLHVLDVTVERVCFRALPGKAFTTS
jgi:hypothetical protein